MKLSDKYQVVIPKEIRREIGLKPGQMLMVRPYGDDSLIITKEKSMDELLEKAANTPLYGPWVKENMDPADWIRKERDEEDKRRNKIAGRE